MTRLLLAAAACAVTMFISVSACSVMPNGPRETCGNQIDDDNNGLIDCADPDCKGKSECAYDGGFFGSCSKCGQDCTNQTQCLTTGYFNDVPLPYCENLDGGSQKKCTRLTSSVQLNVILNGSAYGGLGTSPASIATRFISKTAFDGSTVNCAAVEAAAPGRTAAEANQLEASSKFSLRGLDVRTLNGAPNSVPIQFINVLTGADYLIWLEMWTGRPDSATKYPTGRRIGFECFDGPAIGQSWSPITDMDNCVAPGVDAGAGSVCRNFNVTAIRGPQP